MNLARVAAWLAAGRFIHTTISILLPVVLVRTLTQGEYGYFKQLDLAATLLLPVLVLGFDKSVTYFVPRQESTTDREISTPILLVLLLSALAVVIGLLLPQTLGTVIGIHGLPLLVAAAVNNAAAESISLVTVRALVASGSTRIAALFPVVSSVPRTLCLVLAAFWFRSIEGVLMVVLAVSLLQIAVSLLVLAWQGHLSFRLELDAVRKHFSYGGILAFVSVVQSWSSRIDRYLVSTFLSPQIFAIYAVGQTHVPFVPILSRALGDATAPRFSLLESQNRHREMAALWKKSAESILPLSLLISTALAVTAHWTIPLVFTSEYAAAVPIFQIWAFSVLLQGFVGTQSILRSLSAFRFLGAVTLGSLLVRLALGLAAIQTGSLVVQALAQISVSFAVIAVQLAYIRRALGVGWDDLAPLQGLSLAVGLALTGWTATALIGSWLTDPLISLLASGVVWGPLGLIMLWRQQVLGKVLTLATARG